MKIQSVGERIRRCTKVLMKTGLAGMEWLKYLQHTSKREREIQLLNLNNAADVPETFLAVGHNFSVIFTWDQQNGLSHY